MLKIDSLIDSFDLYQITVNDIELCLQEINKYKKYLDQKDREISDLIGQNNDKTFNI